MDSDCDCGLSLSLFETDWFFWMWPGGSEKAKILKLGMNNSQNIARREARYQTKRYFVSATSQRKTVWPSASAPAGGGLGGPGLTLQEQTHRRREIGGWNKFGQIRPLWLKSAEPRPAALTWVLILFTRLASIPAEGGGAQSIYWWAQKFTQ